MSEELKPCPFCGGEATLISGFDLCGEYWVASCANSKCASVECRPFWHDGKNQAIAAWNRRAPEPGTSIVRWTRYDGTPKMLLEKILPMAMWESCIYKDDPKARPTTHCCDWNEIVEEIQAVLRPKTPEPPEAAKWHSAETEQ